MKTCLHVVESEGKKVKTCLHVVESEGKKVKTCLHVVESVGENVKTYLWKGWRGESEDLSVEGDGEEKVKTYL